MGLADRRAAGRDSGGRCCLQTRSETTLGAPATAPAAKTKEMIRQVSAVQCAAVGQEPRSGDTGVRKGEALAGHSNRA